MVLLTRSFARFAFAALIALTLAHQAHGEVLFEGYSKVILDGKHVGYVVQRYEFDTKKKEFKTAYYLKTNATAGNITESLKARSNENFHPLSYQFTELVGDKAKTIDADFKGDEMTATVTDAGRKQIIQKKIPKGSFLSSFLAYVMLQGKEGIKKGVKYSYQAIAEEDASISSGDAFISDEKTMLGLSAFEILNTFKGTQFISYCTYKGEVIATRSPVQKIETELVPNVRDAVAGMSLNSSALTQLFGAVPRGEENPLARRASDSEDKSIKASAATPPKGTDPAPTTKPKKDVEK